MEREKHKRVATNRQKTKKKKAHRWRGPLLVLLVLAVLSGAAYLGYRVFKIKEITVEGNNVIPQEQIIALSGIHLEDNLFLIRTGQVLSLIHILHTLGARLTINDAKERAAFAGALDFMNTWDVDWRLGQAPDALIDGKDLIVFSSGVPFWSPWIQTARQKGIPCINELQLGFWMSQAPFVAITGTNGKTTTTTLTCKMFENAHVQSFAVGNIGIPVCTHALEMQPDGVMVAEVAPFQPVSYTHLRQQAPIETTGQLVEVIKAAIPASARREGPHPAKRTAKP